MGIIEKRGSWFSFGSEQLAQGRDAVKALLAEKPELADAIYQKIKDALAAQRAANRSDDTPADGADQAAVPADQVNA